MSARIPDQLHALKGTRPTRARQEEPSKVAAGRPRCPKHLSPEGVLAWKEAVRIMRKNGTLSASDGATLEVYAETKAAWIQAKADVQVNGQIITETRITRSGAEYTVQTVNPSVKIAQEASRQLLNLAKVLGLTPQTREKVKRARTTTGAAQFAPGTVGAMLAARKKEQVC